jgi:hypothetical protein
MTLPVLARSMAIAAFVAALAGPAVAQDYAYSDLDLDACEVLRTYEEGGGVDLRCDGYGGFDVFVSEGDARMDVDFGQPNETFQTFSAFNSVGTKVEWFADVNGVQAAILRFLIDVDGRSAQALVVSKVGIPDAPGCVIGVVNAAAEQANGVARGLAAMAPAFDCDSDPIAVLAGKNTLVGDFSGAMQ